MAPVKHRRINQHTKQTWKIKHPFSRGRSHFPPTPIPTTQPTPLQNHHRILKVDDGDEILKYR